MPWVPVLARHSNHEVWGRGPDRECLLCMTRLEWSAVGQCNKAHLLVVFLTLPAQHCGKSDRQCVLLHHLQLLAF